MSPETTSTSPGLRRVLDREVAAVLMSATLLAVALLPTNAAALTGLIACVSWGVLIPIVRPHPEVIMSRATGRLVAAAAIVALGALTRSLFAVNPWVSVWGLIGQHTGSLLWIAVFAVFALTLTSYRAGDVGSGNPVPRRDGRRVRSRGPCGCSGPSR